MAFTKENEYKVEVLSTRVLQVRRTDIIKEDGVIVASSYHRHCVCPGEDYSNEAEVVQLIAKAVHDPVTVAAYQASAQEELD